MFFSITYIISLFKKLIKASEETEMLNQSLGKMVEERTAILAARNLELAQANAELQQLDQMKSDFVSLVSHELALPLTNLNGAVGIDPAKRGSNLPPIATRSGIDGARKPALNPLCTKSAGYVAVAKAGELTLNFGPVAVIPPNASGGNGIA